MAPTQVIAAPGTNGGIPVYVADARENLRQRSNSLHIKEVGHARVSGRSDRWGRLIGLAVVILTTITGTTVFTELGNSTGTAAKIAVGVIATIAAVLAAVKEQAAFGKASAAHAEAAANYGALHHHVEKLILDWESKAPSAADLDKELEGLNKKEGDLNQKAPVLGGRAYDWAKQWVEVEARAR